MKTSLTEEEARSLAKLLVTGFSEGRSVYFRAGNYTIVPNKIVSLQMKKNFFGKWKMKIRTVDGKVYTTDVT